MAGRYSKEYRPNEFVKLPFEEVAKVMAMKEQQYQQGYLQPAAYQQKMGELEVRTPDIEYHQKLINDATNKARQLAEETYGGDYGAAASDITRTLANEASNPFYGWTKSKMDEYKKAKDIEMKLKAEGKYIGFDEGLLNTAYYDKETGNINKNLKSDLQEQLNYSDEMMKIWNYGLHEEAIGTKGDLASANEQSKLGKAYVALTGYTTSGINNTQITNKEAQALALYEQTNAYKQQKRVLMEKEGLSEEKADKEIALNMLKAGEFKKYQSVIANQQVLSSGGGGNGGGSGSDSESDPNSGIKTTANIESNPYHQIEYDNFKKTTWNKFKQSSPIFALDRNEINVHTKKYKQLKDAKTRTDRTSPERDKLEKQIKEEENIISSLNKKLEQKVNMSPISNLSQKDKQIIKNDPVFANMQGDVDKILSDKSLTYAQAEQKLAEHSNIINNNVYNNSRNYYRSFQSSELDDNVKTEMKNFFDAKTFKAYEQNSKKNVNKVDMIKELGDNFTVKARGDGQIILTSTDGAKSYVVGRKNFSDQKAKALGALQNAQEVFNSFGVDSDGNQFNGGVSRLSVPIRTTDGDLIPRITPGNKTVELLNSNGQVIFKTDINNIYQAYHNQFISTGKKYTLTVKVK